MVSVSYARRLPDAGVGSWFQDLTRQDVEYERHKDVLERVLEVTTHPSGPTTVQTKEGEAGNRSRGWPGPCTLRAQEVTTHPMEFVYPWLSFFPSHLASGFAEIP